MVTDTRDIIDKLCISCVESKFILVIKRNKSMMVIIKKFIIIHAKLWATYNLSSQLDNIYSAILIFKHIFKFWMLY